MRPNELRTRPDTEPQGLAPGCHRRYLPGLFEEEEERISIASHVVKVESEDPAPTGCIRDDRLRRCVDDSQSWVLAPLRVEFLLKTDSGYPRDAEST